MVAAGRYKFMPLFYAFHHPIYQDIEFFDLLNTVSYTDEVKKMLFENTTFTSSDLEHNHQGGDFLFEGKIKRHKMVVPKGQISADTWRTISRGIDEIELIFKKAEEYLNVDTKDVYRDTDLYHEIVSWRALLRSSEMLDTYQLKGDVRNIYGEILPDDLVGLTENSAAMMYDFFDLKLQGKDKSKSSRNYFDSDDDY